MNLDANVNESLPFNEPAHEIWILNAHRWTAKVHASLRICAVSSEPSLFTYTKYDSGCRLKPNKKTLIPHGSFDCMLTE